MKSQYYVYTHSTFDGRVFYVGKGQGNRAWDFKARSTKHKRVVSTYGIVVDIVWRTDIEEEARAYEKRLIEFFGTFTTDWGDDTIACNFTPDGSAGFEVLNMPWSIERREAYRIKVRATKEANAQRLAKLSPAKRAAEVARREFWRGIARQQRRAAKQLAGLRGKICCSLCGKKGHNKRHHG